MQHYTGPGYEEEVGQGKLQFSEWAGAFDETSPLFELRMAQFSDWYVFTRVLGNRNMTPIEASLNDSSFQVTEEERSQLQNLRNNRHSLFEFLKLKKNDVYVKDLFNGLKYVIKDSLITAGFDSREYFEARLIPHNDGFIFSNSFCFHPEDVNRFISKEIRAVKKSKEIPLDEGRENLILKLFQMKCKHERYKHLKLKDIYSNNSKLKF
ncbi:MAG TPA: hypothetical protein DCL41_00350 [Bdellovibrionales bacterium]|nr:hypothetical protein [Pseudobdellovibrionaceae bacterium]HAG90288.1 hypothetical protein [Bdellovibrionales bacterium]